MIRSLATWLLSATILLSPGVHAQVEMLDRIVAVVNDGVIMESELQERVDEIARMLAGETVTKEARGAAKRLLGAG
mgnify:CR=1 FL=1